MAAFREIRRVLKPGAISLHLFPARWAPVEVHVRVPLAGVVQTRWWLGLWARLGARNQFQERLDWRDVLEWNHQYLHENTHYVGGRRLLAAGRRCFDEVRFVEKLAIKHRRRTQRLYPLVRAVPFLAWAYGGMRARLLLLGVADG
jgi:hypothetical protein